MDGKRERRPQGLRQCEREGGRWLEKGREGGREREREDGGRKGEKERGRIRNKKEKKEKEPKKDQFKSLFHRHRCHSQRTVIFSCTMA